MKMLSYLDLALRVIALTITEASGIMNLQIFLLVMKRPTGYSLRASDSLTVPRFNSIYGKNSIAHRGSVLWNILVSEDKNFSSTCYKNLKKKTCSMDIFKELTFKETSTTTTNFRRKDFNYI